MRIAFALSALVAIAGCAGGYKGPFRPVTVQFQIDAALVTPLTAPLATGASATANVRERRCVIAQYDPTLPAPPGAGCGAYYVPTNLTPVVLPIQSTNQPCPVTATVTMPGTVKITRSGPGDPQVMVNGNPGGCIVEMQDQTVQARAYDIYV